jgi:hypothetical protein
MGRVRGSVAPIVDDNDDDDDIYLLKFGFHPVAAVSRLIQK